MKLKFKELNISGYERVTVISEEESGLEAIIALHNTTLGPALGGTRFFNYKVFDDALEDVLRLSRGMTYKAAIANLPLGGGKSVVMLDPTKPKPMPVIRAFAEAVNELQGRYICAADYGCRSEDIIHLSQLTSHIVGVATEKSSGDPAPYTAWGTIKGIEATLNNIYGSSSIQGKTIAIQGLGNVGIRIAEYLYWRGALLIVSDLDESKLAYASQRFGAKTVALEKITTAECDILVPCAIGKVFNEEIIGKLNCKGIAGCANNQLTQETDAKLIKKLGIVYAPDFVISGGGLINVSFELKDKGYDPIAARNKIDEIYETLETIYAQADKTGASTHMTAVALAEYRLKFGSETSEINACLS